MPHVLLIEPDALLAQTYAAAMEAAGYSVSRCALAQSGVLAADEARPDVVVLEMQLVGHSGVEFLYEFRSYADWQNVPLIVLTHVPPQEFAGSRRILRDELGVRTYLYKPQTTLRSLLRSLQELAPAGQER